MKNVGLFALALAIVIAAFVVSNALPRDPRVEYEPNPDRTIEPLPIGHPNGFECIYDSESCFNEGLLPPP